MAKTVNNILELIGNTPVVKLNKIIPAAAAIIYAKLESFNPMCSVKDRIALSMIEAAEKDGKIKPGDTLVEPTSGNTGIGLAYISAFKGYRLILTMPDTMSIERQKILKALGAEIVLTEGAKGMKGSIQKAMDLAAERHGYLLQQFNNAANPEIHRKTTAREILEQVPDLDAFVAGVGTGGTITGVGEILREHAQKQVKIIAVEPKDSPVLSGGNPGPHKLQGIGAGFVPAVLNREIIDEIITVTAEDAFATSRQLARQEGIMAGISSGAACWASIQVARAMGPGKKIVTLFPDHGERYLSTVLFTE